MDSSGKGLHQYARWNAKGRRRREFRKFHAAVEARGPEKVIYSAELTRATAHDSPRFIPLLERVEGPLGIVSADAAHPSRKNVQYVADRGGIPRIQPKENVKETTPAKWAPAWKRMVRDRRRRPKRWLRQYHQRSNSEAVNGSFKKRQGSYLFSRRWRNQVAELHLKVVVYNLRLLVRRRVRVALA